MNTARNGILAGGTWIVDHVKLVNGYPEQDTLASILGETRGTGGSPYNVLLNLAKLGAPFPLAGVGLVGEDGDGHAILADCAANGIETTQVRPITEAATSYTDVMTVQSTGRRTFFHYRGANRLLREEHFDLERTQARILHLGYLLLLDGLDAVRSDGVVRIDSAVDPGTWANNPQANTALIADTFRRACDEAEAEGERLAAEGESCWGGMHSWKEMLKLLELVNRPRTLGFQADLAHTLLYLLGCNAPADALLPANFDWCDSQSFEAAYRCLTDALRPWTIDFHVAQNDATVKGQGSHNKTGRHCLPDDPKGKLDIVRAAGFWLRDGQGNLTQNMRHICWDGCMFSNEIMLQPGTWNSILAKMIEVRRAHGWQETQIH